MPTTSVKWTRAYTLAAFHLYTLLPFGKLHRSTSEIQQLADSDRALVEEITAWRIDDKNRLNPLNGLCLSAPHNRAYDQDLMTVMPDFTVRVSPKLNARKQDGFTTDALLRFHGRPIRLPERFSPAPEFLAFHARMFGFEV